MENLLGLAEAEALSKKEGEIAAIRLADLARNPLPGAYDLDHLCAFHHAIFRDVYGWAGKVRTVNIAKAPVPFCSVMHIGSEAVRIFGLIRSLEPVPANVDQAAERAAEALGELNSLHPFREGNGRAQRAFLRQWLSEYGWLVDWSAIDPQENIEACQVSLIEADHAPLADLIRPHLVQG